MVKERKYTNKLRSASKGNLYPRWLAAGAVAGDQCGGEGLVLVIGCGHPTIQRIVARAEMLFDPPIYGIVGGLHYPVTESRSKAYGIPRQAIFGTGKWPWDPINRRDVQEAIAFLQSRQPGLVSLSPHDSCDWTIEALRQAFGEAYQDLFVGREIAIQ